MDNNTVIEFIAAVLVLAALIIFVNVNKQLEEQESKLNDERLFKEYKELAERNRSNRIKSASKAAEKHKELQIKKDDITTNRKAS